MGETIVAVSTPKGVGAIAVVRMSGSEALSILSNAWKGADPLSFNTHSAHLGWIVDSDGKDIDQVVVTFFKGPKSYTGEDIIEISCHGSLWIQQAIVNRLIECGARSATAGEYTRRAFMNGRLDLAQVDGVADLIVASSKAGARLAASQMKGEFSSKLEELRRQLVDLGVLLELELDFSEEDVEFADRSKLIVLASEIISVVRRLTASFRAGNAFKNGVPVAIAGVPNAGKSSLLNVLLGEERAIVSNIPGTTRDVIEDCIEIDGILFRFIDTAGLRESDDEIERIGVEKAKKRILGAAVLLYLVDPTQPIEPQLETLKEVSDKAGGEDPAKIIVLLTKSDLINQPLDKPIEGFLEISAKEIIGIRELKDRLVESATGDFNPEHELIVTNARHYEALNNSLAPLSRLLEGLETGLSADFLAQDLREADRYLGEITGAVTSEEILHSIFARYCIGK